MEVLVTVGEVVEYARKRARMSTRQLSASAGLSPSYVSKLESGHLDPSFHAFSKIANLTMTPAEIVACVRLEAVR